MPGERGFGRSTRLRRRSDFLKVAGGKGSFKIDGDFCRVRFTDSESQTSFGISITRKVGGAVVRNRLKRRIREYLRNNKAIWPSNKMIVISLNSKIDDGDALLNEIGTILGRIE